MEDEAEEEKTQVKDVYKVKKEEDIKVAKEARKVNEGKKSKVKSKTQKLIGMWENKISVVGKAKTKERKRS